MSVPCTIRPKTVVMKGMVGGGGVTRTLCVVIKERVVVGSVDQNVRTAQHPQAPGHVAISADAGAVKCGIVEGSVCGERLKGIWLGLVVGRLGLQLRRIDVLGAVKLVVVQGVVLHGGADKPDWTSGGFDEETAP